MSSMPNEYSFSQLKLQQMKDLLRSSVFPPKAPLTTKAWDLGMDHQFLIQLKDRFLNDWSWDRLKSEINRYDNYVTAFDLEGKKFDMHYVYARSPHSDAIPLILLHGWPGSFVAIDHGRYSNQTSRDFLRFPQGY